METFELRYFTAVARTENLHRAAESSGVSPASLSKAIARLENELGVVLFRRTGRTIQLTDDGRLLQRRSLDLLHLEESTRIELSGGKGAFQAIIAGPEVLLAHHGLAFCDRVRRRFPLARFEFLPVYSDAEALARVQNREAHVACVSSPIGSGYLQRELGTASFQVCVGAGHPLHDEALNRRPIAIESLLKYGFVSPARALLGQVDLGQSLDGWRDDKFQRKIEYVASSLSAITELVVRGRVLGYLPDYWRKRHGLGALRVSGCPYSCKQELKLVAVSQRIGWLNQVM